MPVHRNIKHPLAGPESTSLATDNACRNSNQAPLISV